MSLMFLSDVENMPGVKGAFLFDGRPGHLLIWVEYREIVEPIRNNLPYTLYAEFCVEEEGLLKFIQPHIVEL